MESIPFVVQSLRGPSSGHVNGRNESHMGLPSCLLQHRDCHFCFAASQYCYSSLLVFNATHKVVYNMLGCRLFTALSILPLNDRALLLFDFQHYMSRDETKTAVSMFSVFRDGSALGPAFSS